MGLRDRLSDAWSAMARGSSYSYKYSPLPGRTQMVDAHEKLTFWAKNHRKFLQLSMAVMAATVLWYLAAATL